MGGGVPSRLPRTTTTLLTVKPNFVGSSVSPSLRKIGSRRSSESLHLGVLLR